MPLGNTIRDRLLAQIQKHVGHRSGTGFVIVINEADLVELKMRADAIERGGLQAPEPFFWGIPVLETKGARAPKLCWELP